jgi:hypothetical protein
MDTPALNSPVTESSEQTVAVMLLDDVPSSLDQVLVLRDQLERMLLSDNSAIACSLGREACIWITRYPSSRSHPEYYELWLEVESVNNRAF